MYSIKFPYNDKLDIRMVYPDIISIRAVIRTFAEKRGLEQPHEIEMHLMHNKLAFGVDLFLLGQLDPLRLGTIDSFPLNVQ